MQFGIEEPWAAQDFFKEDPDKNLSSRAWHHMDKYLEQAMGTFRWLKGASSVPLLQMKW